MTTTTPANGLLTEATTALRNAGFQVVKNVHDSIDGLGTTHLIFRRGDEMFSVRGKEYRYKNRASFGLEQVEEARSRDYVLLSYIQQDREFYVFDAAHVLDSGSTYTQPSKHSVSRTWIEVDGSAGVTLKDYIKNGAEPESLAGKNTTLGAY